MTQVDERRQQHQRRRSRRLALQALYQWQLAGEDVSEVYNQFIAEQDVSGADIEYFGELIHSIPAEIDKLEAALAPYMDRKPSEIDPVERSVLLVATYELMHRQDVPYRVVINEAIDLTKKFGADQAHKFVNGVLDKAVKDLRKLETGGGFTPGA
jgi:transcription antitermination protein NusB